MFRRFSIGSILMFPALALCEGVLASKEQPFHSNDAAKVVRFDRVSPEGFVTWFSVDGKRVRFESTQWFRYVEFPPALIEAVDPNILPSRLKQLGTMEEFANQFKRAAPLMKEEIIQVRSETDNLKSGLVLFKRNWIPRAEYDATIKKQAEEIERKKQEVASREEHARQLEIQRLKSETNLQIAKIEERRSKKLQSLRDEIAQFSKERDGLRQRRFQFVSE
jgi:hypothetical protein